MFLSCSERLAKEREITEDRVDKRLEILKNLVGKSVSECASVSCDKETTRVSLIQITGHNIRSGRKYNFTTNILTCSCLNSMITLVLISLFSITGG